MGTISFLSATEISRTKWMSLSVESPVATWFQTVEAYDFYCKLPDIFNPFAYGVEENSGLVGVIVGYVTKERNVLKQLLSRRAIVIGGPILGKDISNEALNALLDGVVDRLKSKAIYIETRNLNDYSKWRAVFESRHWKYEAHLNFHIDTSALTDPFVIMGESRKRNIKTSLKKGDEIVDNSTISQVREYYSILSELYAKRVKTPLFPFSFFEKLYDIESSRFLLINNGKKILGGIVCICMDGRSVYEWFVCGMDDYEKGNNPSSVATYAGIKYAVDNNYPRFDFMGAGRPDEDYGVRDFKARFGGKLVEHGRFKYVCSPLLYKIGCLGVKILKSL